MPRNVNHYIQMDCQDCLAVCVAAQAMCRCCFTGKPRESCVRWGDSCYFWRRLYCTRHPLRFT